ncbi:hypothetical protein PAMP_016642 [Pampus punctatissimus]
MQGTGARRGLLQEARVCWTPGRCGCLCASCPGSSSAQRAAPSDSAPAGRQQTQTHITPVSRCTGRPARGAAVDRVGHGTAEEARRLSAWMKDALRIREEARIQISSRMRRFVAGYDLTCKS